MASSNPDVAVFEAVARQDASLKWYAIADSAQHRDLPNALVQSEYQVRCLLGADQGSPVAKQAPHLVELGSPQLSGKPWHWIGLKASTRPCVSVISTTMSFDALFDQLAERTEVLLPDDYPMFFAFWDPAILGTLVGQPDDLTLHVAGPVLTLPQLQTLLHQIDCWWYWDRDGKLHAVTIAVKLDSKTEGAFFLDQKQVDDLVEASVPDHILYYMELNQPLLIKLVQKKHRYQFVRRCLTQAHAIGLSGVQDLVNHVCLVLIYGERLDEDPVIHELLNRVRRDELSFSDALEIMP